MSGTPAWPQEPVAQGGALPATLPLRREPPGAVTASSWLAATGALALLVLGGAVLVGRNRKWAWLRRVERAAPGRELVRVSSQALTAQASLHAVRWKGEDLLLACTAQQVVLVARRPAEPLREDAA